MYKYLTTKIANEHGFFVNQLTVLAFEALREEQNESEIMEEFSCLETKEICEVVNFNQKDETLKYIEEQISEKSLAHALFIQGRTGFLAQIHTPVNSGFKFKEDGSVSYSIVSQGYCRVGWVYADTLGELADKGLEISNKIYESEKAKALKEHLKTE